MTVPAVTPLRDALVRQLDARMGAAMTLLMVLGDDPDLFAVLDWVTHDPHTPPPSGEFVTAIDQETRHLRDFDAALLGAMTWTHPGGGW